MTANQIVRRLAILLCLSACGCASGGLLKVGKKDFPRSGPENPVVQVLALWQPANGTGLDGKACRGFAGQIMFLTHKSSIPAEVDGDIRVYVFDDQGTREEQTRPFHQFDFPGEVWKTYLQLGQLGPSYGLFIPYTRKGRQEAQCSLRVRYTAPDGRVAYSEMLTVELPGVKKVNSDEDTDEVETPEPAISSNRAPARQSSASTQSRQASRSTDVPGIDQIIQAHASRTDGPGRAAQREHTPLNAAERQRIVRETLARMARQNGGSDDSAEEEDVDVPLERAKPRHSRISHALAESHLDVESDDDAPLAQRRPVPARSNPVRRPALDLDAEEADEVTHRPIRQLSHEEPAPARPKARKHPLRQSSDDDDEVSDRRVNTFTIELPRRARS